MKTSVYVDEELWEGLKRRALEAGVEVSALLEELIRDEVPEFALSEALLELAGAEDYCIDFEPVELTEGLVSELVREMRDERARGVPGQQRDS